MEFIFPSDHNFQIVTFTDSTHTALEAATALKCSPSQIAKSLVFYVVPTHQPILIIASGSNRVDKDKVSNYLHQKIKTASPEFVLAATGYSPGSVPPFSHQQKIRTLIDQSLFNYPTIWAAAGSPTSVFSIAPSELKNLTQGEVLDVSEQSN